MTYGIMGATPRKEPKMLSARDEERLAATASTVVETMKALYPEAREIDLLNAFLAAFRGDHDA